MHILQKDLVFPMNYGGSDSLLGSWFMANNPELPWWPGLIK